MRLAGLTWDDEPRGPLGHSDGDAVLHALIDALLGAAASRRRRDALPARRGGMGGRRLGGPAGRGPSRAWPSTAGDRRAWT